MCIFICWSGIQRQVAVLAGAPCKMPPCRLNLHCERVRQVMNVLKNYKRMVGPEETCGCAGSHGLLVDGGLQIAGWLQACERSVTSASQPIAPRPLGCNFKWWQMR